MSKLPVVQRFQSSFAQLTRYAFVGILSNLIGYLVYLLLTYIGATPKLTMSILYGVGAAIGYFGHKNMTFAHKGSILGSGVRFIIVHCFGYCINFAILSIFVDKIGYLHQWVQAVAIFIVAGFLFIAFKFFVFTDVNASNMGRL